MEILPKQLNRIISALLLDCSISGWKLYGGNKQKLVIDFVDMDSENDCVCDPQLIQYKRKPKGQILRDNKRAKMHQHEKSTTNMKDTDKFGSFTKLRDLSQEVADKELARAEDNMCELDEPCLVVNLDIGSAVHESNESCESLKIEHQQRDSHMSVNSLSPIDLPQRPDSDTLLETELDTEESAIQPKATQQQGLSQFQGEIEIPQTNANHTAQPDPDPDSNIDTELKIVKARVAKDCQEFKDECKNMRQLLRNAFKFKT